MGTLKKNKTMIKRTLYFGNPAYLKTTNEQLVVTLPENKSGLTEAMRSTTIPIEDIGIVILDHQQITISQALMAKLLANNVALITCDTTHHPTGMMLNLNGNTLQAERFALQLNVTVPLKKTTMGTNRGTENKQSSGSVKKTKARRPWRIDKLYQTGAER